MFILPTVSATDIIINSSDSIQNTVNNAGFNDVIYLNPGVYNESQIHIAKNVTFQGNGLPDEVIINGMNKNSIIFINSTVTVHFNNITFIRGSSDDYGGAINSENAKLYIDNCMFINNTAKTVNGGAINSAGTYDIDGYLFVNKSIFINNYAGHDGGAVATYIGNTNIYNSEFYYNYAYRDGGAIRGGIYSKTYLKYCIFQNNKAKEWVVHCIIGLEK